ncbi:tRNA (guanosine(46)-N7)-methyltransferase TrmB [Effusibacillus dendaii]|uniref:tRNA (guanine-N(7)-)-methyltransferase n=1 Tax=Effusibacillus dendaii TaxID=2743772 RepID=A0A7I8DGV2_9BACL|nr:tRNA (guanine-N(7)-)-methyltransferase [Effusibacillus dendaii]
MYEQVLHEFVQNPAEYRGQWREKMFGNDAPLHIELGTGRGRFITTMAAMHPQINYIGIELFPEVIVRVYQKKQQLQVTNLALICMDAANILEVFEDQEVDRIYLNFSDPWPKTKQADKRLTARPFLDKYRQILKRDGEIHFKTDNRDLFDFSLEMMEAAGWQLKNVTYDLCNSDFEGNVMTEYEEKFSQRGVPICRLEATPPTEVER